MMLNTFSCAYWLFLYPLWGRFLFKSSLPLFNWVIFWITDLYNFFNILEMNWEMIDRYRYMDIYVLWIFSHSSFPFLYFLNDVFYKQKLLVLMKINIIFFLLDNTFCSRLKIYLTIPVMKIFFLEVLYIYMYFLHLDSWLSPNNLFLHAIM